MLRSSVLLVMLTHIYVQSLDEFVPSPYLMQLRGLDGLASRTTLGCS